MRDFIVLMGVVAGLAISGFTQDGGDAARAAIRKVIAGHEMGKLEFANLRIEMLGAEAAFVRGEFHLTMSDGKTPHGLFTLVFRKFPEGWKIVHDHSAGE